MSAISALGAFVLAAGLLTITPGLDTVLVLRTWVADGRRRAVQAVLGVQVGCLLWGCAVAIGLGAVLVAAPLLYDALRWCGALYLVWCGIGMLLKPRGTIAPGEAAPAARPFRRGLFTNLLNPKVGLFYLSFLPQFVPQGWPPAPTMVGLTVIHIALALAWFGLLLSGATTVRSAITERAGLIRGLDRLTGFVFVGFGLRLAFERR